MGWQVVAEGISFDDLEALIADRDLPAGTEIRVEMDTAFPWYFDGFYAESQFKQYTPEGCTLIDVWGEGPLFPWQQGGKAYAKMVVDDYGLESQPGKIGKRVGYAWVALIPLLASIAKWGLIALAIGIVVSMLVTFVKVMMKIADVVTGASPYLIWALIIGGCAVAGYFGYRWISDRNIRAGPVAIERKE